MVDKLMVAKLDGETAARVLNDLVGVGKKHEDLDPSAFLAVLSNLQGRMYVALLNDGMDPELAAYTINTNFQVGMAQIDALYHFKDTVGPTQGNA